MNSLELLFALLAVASFAAFAANAEKHLQKDWKEVSGMFGDKASATECAALANQYYANAGGTLNRQMQCTIERGYASSRNGKSPAIPAALPAGSMLVEVERHYGK